MLKILLQKLTTLFFGLLCLIAPSFYVREDILEHLCSHANRARKICTALFGVVEDLFKGLMQ